MYNKWRWIYINFYLFSFQSLINFIQWFNYLIQLINGKMTFIHMKSSILRCGVLVGKSASSLGVLSRGPPLSLFDMLLAIGGGLRIWCSFVVCFLGWFFHLFGCESFHLVPYILLLLSVLVYVWFCRLFNFKRIFIGM